MVAPAHHVAQELKPHRVSQRGEHVGHPLPLVVKQILGAGPLLPAGHLPTWEHHVAYHEHGAGCRHAGVQALQRRVTRLEGSEPLGRRGQTGDLRAPRIAPEATAGRRSIIITKPPPCIHTFRACHLRRSSTSGSGHV